MRKNTFGNARPAVRGVDMQDLGAMIARERLPQPLEDKAHQVGKSPI
jgi:hypothetical protein